MKNTPATPWIRIIFGSLIVALIAMFHVNFLTIGNGAGWGFLISFILIVFLSFKKKESAEIREFQWKTASILSFLLPITAIIFSFIFTGKAVSEAGSSASQTGSVIGGFIGGGVVTLMAFIIGISLGIVFYILSKKSKK